jgi:hypothetical protein
MILILFFLSIVCSHSFAQDVDDKNTWDTARVDAVKAQKAKDIVQMYMHDYFEESNADAAIKHCAVPFAWDRWNLISSMEELKAQFAQTIQEKKGGSRKLTIDKITVEKARREIIDQVIPVDVYYVKIRIKIEGMSGTEGVLFAVQMTPEPKIIGLCD